MLKVRHAQRSLSARAWLALAATAALLGAAQAQQSPPPSRLPLPKADPPAKRIVTQGLAKTVTEDLIPCANPRPGMNLRKNPVGEIAAQDGTTLTVPVANNFATAPKLPDLYNECAGVTPKDMSEVDLNKVPIVELDKDGEEAVPPGVHSASAIAAATTADVRSEPTRDRECSISWWRTPAPNVQTADTRSTHAITAQARPRLG